MSESVCVCVGGGGGEGWLLHLISINSPDQTRVLKHRSAVFRFCRFILFLKDPFSRLFMESDCQNLHVISFALWCFMKV